MKRILTTFILIAVLPATPPSVEKLLRKPRIGAALICLTDGSSFEAGVVRVTWDFIAVRQQMNVCRQFPVDSACSALSGFPLSLFGRSTNR